MTIGAAIAGVTSESSCREDMGTRGTMRQAGPERLSNRWGGDGLRELHEPAGDVFRGGRGARGAAVSVGQVRGPLSPAELVGGGGIGDARLARGLALLGIAPGDRVALVSENRPEWVIADLAIMAAGAVTVPAYVTNTVEDHRHILVQQCGARAAIVSTAALAARLVPAAAQVPSVRTVISMESGAIEDVGEAPANFDLRSWEDVLALGGESDGPGRVEALMPDDTACIIYTSGTGGVPKGVMLSHRNIIANCRGAYRLLEILGLGDDKFLSFLPLSHSYEHTAGLMFPISIGAEIYFAEGARRRSRPI